MPRHSLMLITVALMFFPFTGDADEKPSPQEDVVVYRRKIEDEREIVIVRGPSFDIQRLRGLLSPDVLKDAFKNFHTAFTAGYHVRVELRAHAKPPLTLWERLIPEPAYDAVRGFDVLDVLVEPDMLDIATAEFGEVFLWRLDLIHGAA